MIRKTLGRHNEPRPNRRWLIGTLIVIGAAVVALLLVPIEQRKAVPFLGLWIILLFGNPKPGKKLVARILFVIQHGFNIQTLPAIRVEADASSIYLAHYEY